MKANYAYTDILRRRLRSQQPARDGACCALLLGEVVMLRDIDGVDLAQLVAREWPEVRILLMSGFPEGHVAHHAAANVPFRLLHQPFQLIELATAIRAVLDIQAVR